jgi:putative NADPH-quinone reductase
MTDSTTTEDAPGSGTRNDGSGSTLVVVAHPALPLSRLDQRIVGVLAGLPRTEVRDLYRLSQPHGIDVRAERRAVLAADEVVMLFPVHSHVIPRLAQEWLAAVFDRRWTHPRGHTPILAGRGFRVVLHGSVEEPAVEPNEVEMLALEPELIRLHQLAHRAHMRWRDAFVLRGSRMPMDGSDEIEWRVQQLVDPTTTR